MNAAKTLLVVLAIYAVTFPEVVFAQVSTAQKRADDVFHRWLDNRSPGRTLVPPAALYLQRMSQHEFELRVSTGRAGDDVRIREQKLDKLDRSERDVPEPAEPATTVTPEPISAVLIGSGLAGLAALRGRRRRVR
jgi:hypothetical protein